MFRGQQALVACAVSLVFAVSALFSCFLLLDLFEGLNALEDLVGLPLSPQKLVVAPVVKVTHGPPETCLQCSPDQYRVVSSANVVLVGSERSVREYHAVVVRLVNLCQELSEVFFLQFEVSLLVFRIGQVLRKLLNLLR